MEAAVPSGLAGGIWRRAPLAVTVGVIVLACLAVIGRRRR
jgi:hypothetical protein